MRKLFANVTKAQVRQAIWSLNPNQPITDLATMDEVLDTLGPATHRGTPMVGLEPSCTAVFRDELPGRVFSPTGSTSSAS